MPRVYHFEITSDQPEKTEKFYQEVFGWKIHKKWGETDDDYWLIQTGASNENGINGGIKPRVRPKDRMIPHIDVPSLDDYLSKVEKNGGKVLSQKIALPGTGYLVYCEDTAGNTICLVEKRPDVKKKAA